MHWNKDYLKLAHPAYNPRYTPLGNRYYERSIYIPHVGVKQVRRERERQARRQSK